MHVTNQTMSARVATAALSFGSMGWILLFCSPCRWSSATADYGDTPCGTGRIFHGTRIHPVLSNTGERGSNQYIVGHLSGSGQRHSAGNRVSRGIAAAQTPGRNGVDWSRPRRYRRSALASLAQWQTDDGWFLKLRQRTCLSAADPQKG